MLGKKLEILTCLNLSLFLSRKCQIVYVYTKIGNKIIFPQEVIVSHEKRSNCAYQKGKILFPLRGNKGASYGTRVDRKKKAWLNVYIL